MLITHCRLVGSEADGALIRDGRIAAIGASRELERAHPQEQRLDARGEWLLPGSICAHTHFYGAFARGMALTRAPANFPEILEQLWWKLDKALTPEDIRYSALVCLLDAIRNGTTTLIDHHASPSAIPGSLDIIAQAAQEAGLRVCLGYEVSDRDGKAVAEEGLAENARFIARIRREGNSRLAALFGLHASLTLSDETLARALDLGKSLDVGFHLHVAEDEADVRDALRRSGMRPVERLAKAGVLGPNSIAAHGVHLDAREIGLLRETGAWVVHNPRSNMNNAVGVAEVERMLAAGVQVGLGNDGFSNDMFQEMKAAYLLHKVAQRDPRAMGADVVLSLAVEHNRRLARSLFPLPLGELTIGAAADLILLDYDPPTPVSAENWPWHVIFGVDGGQVTMTMVGGDVLIARSPGFASRRGRYPGAGARAGGAALAQGCAV